MHRHAVIRCFLLGGTALTWLLATPALIRAETFLLKSGGRIEAEQLNPARTPTEPYLLKTPLGLTLSLTPSQVHRVVVRSDVQKQYDAQVLAMPNTADGHWQMSEWCKEAGLLNARKQHLQAVLDLAPDHEQARAALGFGRVGNRWMTMDDVMVGLGYVRAGGVWKTPQQLEIEVAKRESELAVKKLRRDLLMWVDQLSGSRRESALANLQSLRDPRAGPTLVELLTEDGRSREIRLLALELLARLPPGLGGQAVIHLAMDEKDDEIRDRCLDELVRMKSSGVASVFIRELQNKDNRRVNRAATCLARLEDPDSTLPLINALVTTHEYLILPEGGGGGGLSFNSAGGFSVGGKPQKKKADHNNTSVLNALTTLHPGVNFEYDETAWRKWYVEKFTTTKVDLRRDE
jgi:hypothetical protein